MSNRSNVSPAPGALVSASVLRRLAALFYDSLLLLALWFLFGLVAVLAIGGEVPAGALWFRVGLVAVAFLFYCGFWARGGETVGMRAWRMRLVADDGGPVSFARAALRFAASFVSLLPAGLGLWWAFVDRDGRSWHDRLSGTRVVLVPRK